MSRSLKKTRRVSRSLKKARRLPMASIGVCLVCAGAAFADDDIGVAPHCCPWLIRGRKGERGAGVQAYLLTGLQQGGAGERGAGLQRAEPVAEPPCWT